MELTFIHISDTHLYVDPNFTGDFVDFSPYSGVKKLIEHINNLPFHIDFVLHTGDVMTDPENAEDYLAAKEVLSELNYPIYYMPGNHDHPLALQQFLFNHDLHKLTPHMSYEFEVKGVQFICLNSHLENEDAGYIDSEQLAWLEELVSAKDERPLVVALHHHAIPLGVDWLDGWVLQNGEELHQILRKASSRLRGVFYGHIHQNICTVRDGISYYSVLSGWYQPLTWYGQINPYGEPLNDLSFNIVTLTQQDTFIRQYNVRR